MKTRECMVARCRPHGFLAFTLTLYLLAVSFGHGQTDRYVWTGGGAPNDGASWATAFPTIDAALTAADPGDTIHLAGETFTLGQALSWSVADLTVIGGYEADPGDTPGNRDPDQWPTVITRDLGQDIRLIDLTAAAAGAAFDGLTFSNGLANVDGLDNWDAQGGALRAVSVTNLNVANCRFTGNQARSTLDSPDDRAYGGAVFLSGGNAVFSNVVMALNSAEVTTGGGLAYGGAFYAIGLSSMELTGCRIDGNDANSSGSTASESFGGGLALRDIDDLRITDCRVLRNRIGTRRAWGGGVYALNVEGEIVGSLVAGNRNLADQGAGRPAYGAGLHLEESDLVLTGNLVAANELHGRSRRGDGVYIEAGNYHLRNMLIINNIALYETVAGALYVQSGTVEAENITITGHAGTGLYTQSGADMTLRNSILFDNTLDIGGALPTLSHNLIGDGTADGVDGNFQDDPAFEFPLYYVASGSAALGAGDRSAADAGMSGMTVLTDGSTYANPALDDVHLGYHFNEGLTLDLELWVDPSAGDDGNPGSEVSPLASITRALELAAPRTRIHLAAGNYTNGVETFPLRMEEKTIQLIGPDAGTTVIDADGAGERVIELINHPLGDNRITGVTIRGGDNTDRLLHGRPSGGGLYLERSALTLRDAVVFDNQAGDGSHLSRRRSACPRFDLAA